MSRARAAATGRPSAEARAVPKPLADRGPAPADEPSDPTEALEPSVEPAAPPLEGSERRTIQIGERPGPLRPTPVVSPDPRPPREKWTLRVVAAVALSVFVLLLVLVLVLGL
jgi:hypothetical protein